MQCDGYLSGYFRFLSVYLPGGFTGDGRNCAVNGKSVSLYKTLNVPMFKHWLLSFNELLAVKQVLSWKNASRCVDSVSIAKSISSISGAWFHNNLVL